MKLTLCLTFRCHHRCQSCGIWQRPKGEEMTAEQLDALFSSVPSLRWLDLTGGEVVVRRDLPQIGRSIRRHLRKLALLHFPTGGWLPDAVMAAAHALRWPQGPRLIITVSIDGPQALHDQIRGVNGAWDRAIESILRLKQAGFEVYPGMTLQPNNVTEVDATVAALAKIIPDFDHSKLHVNVAHTSSHYFDNNRKPRASAAQVRAAITSLRNKKRAPRDPVSIIEAIYLSLLEPHLRHGRSPISCRSGELSAYISPQGEVFACTIDPRSMGHLKAHQWDLGKLWQQDTRSELVADIKAGRCVGCWTPCEAYQGLLTSPVAVANALRQAR